MSKLQIIVTFEEIPDVGRHAGYLCWVGRERPRDDVPMGSGATLGAAFEDMVDRIAARAVDSTMRSFGVEV